MWLICRTSTFLHYNIRTPWMTGGQKFDKLTNLHLTKLEMNPVVQPPRNAFITSRHSRPEFG